MATQTISKGITRFDTDEQRGFMVRICRNGEHFNEYFSDSRFGGKRKAKKAAIERYEQLVDELGPAAHPTKNKITARNTTGVVGVHVAQTANPDVPDNEYWAYCASWVEDDGRRRKINFSWNKYGKKDAWELACMARESQSTDRDKLVQKLKRRKSSKKKRK